MEVEKEIKNKIEFYKICLKDEVEELQESMKAQNWIAVEVTGKEIMRYAILLHELELILRKTKGGVEHGESS